MTAHCRTCAKEKYEGEDLDVALARRFSMSLEQLHELSASQRHKCAVCEVPREEAPRATLMIDHDHACCPNNRSCGRCVRGLLCLNCNIALGNFRDDPKRLIAAVKYLANSQGVRPRDP